LFDTADTVCSALEVVAGVWTTLKLKPDRIASSLDGMILATDLADYLARKGLPFRECHRIVGQLVKSAGETGRRLDALDLETLQAASDAFGPDVSDILSPEQSTSGREIRGGTGKRAVSEQIAEASRILESRSRPAR
jgi:argininosuccinate lyase